MLSDWLNPNLSAWSLMTSGFSCIPSSAKGMLHDRIWAVAMDTVAPGPQVVSESFFTTVPEPGSGSDAGFGSWLSLVYWPVPKALALITGLKVDPGGFRLPPIVRLISGSPDADSSWLYVVSTALPSCDARVLGS